ncbi:MAG: phosphotransferase [Clostridium sp.]|nr:phosphotransferase [Clostridium sp.]
MNIDYIIVQAGGKGTRMEHLTANKPKCLVPVNNLPMLFHLFRKYPDKKFIVIGDYKCDVLREYLKTFAKVSYLLIDAGGCSGTCAGLKQAVEYIPKDRGFMLIWSDLVLPEDFELPQEFTVESGQPADRDYIGLSGDFKCRWKYENGIFEEEASIERGVAGFFIFHNKDLLERVPEEGEFVRWLKEQNVKPKELVLRKTKEYGLISEYRKLIQEKCRPFNRMTVEGDRIRKEGIDEQGKKLAVREKAWYQHVESLGYDRIPKIYSYEPFVMEKVTGKNVYEYEELSYEQKKEVLTGIMDNLKFLHSLGEQETDYFSIKETYIDKTFDRLEKIRDLIPFGRDRFIRINGRNCRNVFFYQKELEKRLYHYRADKFQLIHGDCTFSNMMLKEDLSLVLIDPRGYFGAVELYGDPAYDWAKLYYSLMGNYDRFNLKQFRLDIEESEVKLKIESNGWEKLEPVFFEQLKGEAEPEDIKLLHAIIWLALTTYAWEDYDSICGAFYNGLYYLEEVL